MFQHTSSEVIMITFTLLQQISFCDISIFVLRTSNSLDNDVMANVVLNFFRSCLFLSVINKI